MAFLDIARTRANYEYAIVFRGTFDSGAAVVWSNAYVKSASGLIDGRITSVGQVTRGVSDASGGAPPRVSCSLELANHDNVVSYAFRGNATSNASVDYFSDGFRNLTGKLYMLVKDPADGSTYESAITPTMVCTGGVDTDGFTVRLNLSSRDDSILGASNIGPITVQRILDSSAGAFGPGTYVTRDGTSGAYSQSLFQTDKKSFKKNLDKPVPFVYGKTDIPMLLVSDTGADTLGRFLLFVSTVEPYIEDFADWELYDKWGVDLGSGDGRYRSYDSNIARAQRVWKIQRAITTEAGATANLWICGFTTQRISASSSISTAELLLQTPHSAIPATSRLGISFAPPAISTENKGPAAILRAMARDHSSIGSSALDSTSFLRVGRELGALAGACGGLYDGTGKLVDAFGRICRAFGIQTWIENDDTLRCFVGWGQADKDEIDAATPYHITQAEILDAWKERLPDNPPERGSVADRVTVKWEKRQTDFYPADFLPDHTAGATQLPAAELHSDDIEGAWIFPPSSAAAMESRAARLAFIARRVEFVGRSWLATQAIGSILFASHVRGQADNSGTGYVLRPMRLESTEFTPGEDGCRVVLADLQGDYDTKPGTLDGISHWIATAPTPGDTVTLTNGSATVVAGIGNVRQFTLADEGRNLWTFGAANSSNRRSYKITHFTDARHVTVEFNYAGATETVIYSGASGWNATWVIMDTQGSKGSAYRPERIRLCSEATGLFRDGLTTGYQV